jgi:hypothetical protein
MRHLESTTAILGNVHGDRWTDAIDLVDDLALRYDDVPPVAAQVGG